MRMLQTTLDLDGSRLELTAVSITAPHIIDYKLLKDGATHQDVVELPSEDASYKLANQLLILVFGARKSRTVSGVANTSAADISELWRLIDGMIR